MRKHAPPPKASVEYLRQRLMHHTPFPDFVACKDEKDAPPPQYQNDNHKEWALVDAIGKANIAIQELKANAAAGDRLAMGALTGFIEELVQWLEDLSYRQETFLQSYARKSACWPMLVALRPQRMKEIQNHLKRLGVGTESEIATGENARWGVAKHKGQSDKGYSTATMYALAIVNTIHCNRARLPIAQILNGRELSADWQKIPQWAKDCLTLPPLTKDTASKWFAIGWQAILEKTNSHPEDVSELRVLGEHRAKKSERSGQQKKTTPRTAAVNIQDGIKKRISGALKSLAPKLPPNSPA